MSAKFAAFDRLARDGGAPVRTRPFAPWPDFDEEMIGAVTDVLRSGRANYWTGQETREFETQFAEFVGVDHAVAVTNGTLALELALVALDIQPGDQVIVPPRTFIATASAVCMRGATPIFADIDPVSGNLTVETISAAITEKTKAIIAVHAAGWPCEMPGIMQLANHYGIKVIEDCAQAHGCTYDGQHVGSFGHISAFSFCQDKIMTTGGEGGMVVTNDKQLWSKAWSFKDHGKDWEAVYERQHDTVFKWLHESIGTNWRMTELAGAIGKLALKRLPDWVESRRQNSAVLNAGLAAIDGLEVLSPADNCHHSYYKYYVNVSANKLTSEFSRDEIVRCLQQEGIPCGSGLCCEIYKEKAIADSPFALVEPLPTAKDFGERSIMFMVHPTLEKSDMEDIITGCQKVMRAVNAVAQPIRRAA